MPFFGKMTSRLRGTAKEGPKSSSGSTKSPAYLDSDLEPRDKLIVDKSRKKVSREDSRGEYDELTARGEKRLQNGHREEYDDGDPDLLYRRSRDHFGSWDIRDITREGKTEFEEKKSKGNRKSRFDLFKSNGSEKEVKKLGNGEAKHGGWHEVREKGSESGHRKYNKSRSPEVDEDDRRDRSSKMKSHDRNRSPDSTRKESPALKFGTIGKNGPEDSHNRPKHDRALLDEIEMFGSMRGKIGKRTIESPERSVERRYTGNRSPELENEKIRSLIEKFKSEEQRAIESQSSSDNKKSHRHRSPSREGAKDTRLKNRRENFTGEGSIDRRSVRKSADKWEDGGKFASLERRRSNNDRNREEEADRESIGRKWNDGKYGSVDPRSRSVNGEVRQEIRNGESETRHRPETRNGRGRESVDTDFRKRSDTYSVDRDRRKSREIEEDAKESWSRGRSQGRDETSPENFDVQIHRYERALTGPRRDLDSSRKQPTREAQVERRSSLKSRDEPERNGRHVRPLTPPEDDFSREDLLRERKKKFSSKDWYESNKKFATKYLEENSKARPIDDRQDQGLEPSKDPRRRTEPTRETYFGDPRKYSPEETHRSTNWSNLGTEPIVVSNGKSDFDRKTERSSRGQPITIKIRTVSEDRREDERKFGRSGVFVNGSNDDRSSLNRNRRSEDERERNGNVVLGGNEWTSVKTPSRTIWNYREGGVQIREIDEGQPCLQCEDACPGFVQHPWRKNCTSCKCPREAHEVCHEEWVSVRSRLGLKGDGPSSSLGSDPRELGLAWAPPGLPPHKIEEYFSMLPEISVPKLGTPGERYRDRQLVMQLPKQDLAKAYCRHLASEHYTSADDFMAARNEIALDIGTVQDITRAGATCAGCKKSLEYHSLAVFAGKLDEHYHPACFQCLQCRELLVDLAYCVYNDGIYCERHYAEKLKGRCAACDELIFSGEFTRAMNKDWHSGHFCCWQCDESLTGQRYVLRDEHPYCIKCYESVFANGCEECNKIIGIDSKDLSYKDKHWHEACFLCNKCRVSLVDKQFGSKVDKIYCGNCYDSQFASRCDGCGEIFRAGTKKMEYKTRQWHEKCFCCVVCKNAIGTKSFIPREQEIYCAGCYEDKFATRCVKCNKIITSGGVTYKNEPWHRECFTCSNCSTSLAGQRFTSRDEKPYCADCFGELFAKRCTACTKPITGIGGTRFISFEDRHWHNDCFICAGCKTSLVGRGFITDADDIICPECAKQKLM